MKDELTKAIGLEMVMKTIEAIPNEQKERLIADALLCKIKDLRIGYAVNEILEAHAMKYVHEYANKPEVQEKLKRKAREAVDDVIDGIVQSVGSELESFIKSKYKPILSGEQI